MAETATRSWSGPLLAGVILGVLVFFLSILVPIALDVTVTNTMIGGFLGLGTAAGLATAAFLRSRA